MIYPGYINYGYYWDYDYYMWSCTASDTSLANCYTPHDYRCYSRTKSLAVVCYSPTQGKRKNETSSILPHLGSNCTNGAVKLTNGTTTNEGRVEYCYEGEWAPFCDISPSTASVICNHLGYSSCKNNI